MIVSNQIKCNKCLNAIYSAHRHDYKTCSCGAVSVDGGQAYLRRTGDDYTDLSIVIPRYVMEACEKAVDNAVQTGRNTHGIANAAIRALRDCGYDMNKFNGE